MTESDGVKQELQTVLDKLGTSVAILNSFESVIEEMKTTVTILGFGSSSTDKPNAMAQSLSRTMLDASIIHTRLQRIKVGLEEWISAV